MREVVVTKHASVHTPISTRMRRTKCVSMKSALVCKGNDEVSGGWGVQGVGPLQYVVVTTQTNDSQSNAT